MVRLPTLNVNWSRDRVYVIRRGVVACCILFCLIGAGVETAAAQRSWPRADTATAAATAAANEPTAVTRKQVPDSGKQGGSRKTQNTQNGDDKAAQSVDWKGPTGKQPDLSQYSDLSVEVSLAKQRVYVKSGGQTIYTMIASTGVDDATPHGSYTIDTRGEHFYNAEEGMGADYWVQFYGSYLFHSVPTGEAFGDYLPEEGAKLGQPASHGCVRLTVADAQWFYDQVPDGTLVTELIVRPHPWYAPQLVVPLTGMLLGNTVTALAVGLSRFYESMEERRDEVDMMLALGATPWESARPSIVSSIRLGLLPTTASLASSGIVTIPGMMAGQVIAGGDPLNAAKYQFVVLDAIAALTLLADGLIMVMIYRTCFTADDQYRPPEAR